jgi:hypothetical protein
MNYLDLTIQLLISLITTFLGIFLVLTLDRKRRADLKITKGEDTEEEKDPPQKYLHVTVENLPLCRIHSFFQDRETALSTRAWITFYHYDDPSQPSCAFDRDMLARWSDNPIPDIPEYYRDMKELQRGLPETMDIQPEEKVRLDIATRIKGDNECYGWNNEGYLYDDHRNADWCLNKGRYLVKVRAKTAGRDFKALFLLQNDGDYESFKLEPIDTREKNKLMKLLPKCSST